jgi:cystathionine beta-lyase
MTNDLTNLAKAIKSETKMVYVETPTNPCLTVVDIAAIAKICKDRGVMFVVDNTFATSYL